MLKKFTFCSLGKITVILSIFYHQKIIKNINVETEHIWRLRKVMQQGHFTRNINSVPEEQKIGYYFRGNGGLHKFDEYAI